MILAGFIDATAMLRGGIYALVHRGVVVYVGKSKVMLTRVNAHRGAWGSKSRKAVGLKPIKGILFDEVWVRPCSLEEIDELEHEMINLYKPRYNQLLRNGLPVDISALVAQLVSTRGASAPLSLIEPTFRRRL